MSDQNFRENYEKCFLCRISRNGAIYFALHDLNPLQNRQNRSLDSFKVPFLRFHECLAGFLKNNTDLVICHGILMRFAPKNIFINSLVMMLYGFEETPKISVSTRNLTKDSGIELPLKSKAV